MKKDIVKKMSVTVFFCIVVLIGIVAVTGKTDAKAGRYKLTKYTSFSEVQKDYLNKELYFMFVLKRAYITVKTKWGYKRAMIISRDGVTPDIMQTDMFVKHKKKVYRIASFIGYANSISKNKKYIFVSGGSTYFMVYRYSGGKYKRFKYVFNDGQDEFDKQRDKLADKYGISNCNIEYTHHKL